MGRDGARSVGEAPLASITPHVFDVDLHIHFAALCGGDTRTTRCAAEETTAARHGSRVYSKHFTEKHKYSYDLAKPDYECANLAQHIVDAILVRFSSLLSFFFGA